MTQSLWDIVKHTFAIVFNISTFQYFSKRNEHIVSILYLTGMCLFIVALLINS